MIEQAHKLPHTTVLFILLIILCSGPKALWSQDNGEEKTVYTGLVNIVKDDFKIPSIGLLNFCRGTHHIGQIGFSNMTANHLFGAQVGLVNVVHGKTIGLQAGAFNFSSASIEGLQLSLLNINMGISSGIQLGFANFNKDTINGYQVGYINYGGDLEGNQIGVINVAKKLNGFQLGLINVMDSIEYGVPIGIFTYIKKGGYKALEIGSNELYPLHLTLQMGIEQLYSFFGINFVNRFGSLYTERRFGLGSLFPIKKSFLNPELSINSYYYSDPYFGLTVKFVHALTAHWHLSIGPAISVTDYAGFSDNQPFLGRHNYGLLGFDAGNIGLSISIRYLL